MKHSLRFLRVLWPLLLFAPPSAAAPAAGEGDWPQWRGPAFNGSAEATGLPSEWSTTRGVVWSVPLPGQSAATPVTWGDHVFLSSLDDYSKRLLAMCVQRRSGEVLWTREIGQGREPTRRGTENTFAACSPVTDGERVCFLYGTGDLVAFDFGGEELWRRELLPEGGKFAIYWGYGASPLLFDGRLYVPVLQRGESYLLALDPASGETLFEQPRPSKARAESQEAYTTPIPFENQGRWEILVLGGDCLTGHDPATGEELWRWCGLNPLDRPNMRTVSSAVVGEGGMVFVTSPQNNPMHGLRVRGTEVEEVWQFDKPTPDVTTPLLYGGRLYAVNGKSRDRAMVCLEPGTGELVWQGDLETEEQVRSSPTGGDGKIYVMDAEGNVVVLAAGDQFEVLARVAMGSYPSRSAIVIDDGELLIRTADRLWCIGASAAGEERD